MHREAQHKPKQTTTGQPSYHLHLDALSGCVTGAGRLARLWLQAREPLHPRFYHPVLVSPVLIALELQKGLVDGVHLYFYEHCARQ